MREVLLVALPLMLSTAAETVMQFTDRMFLAQWSVPAFKAALPAGVLCFTFVGFFTSLAWYAGTFVAQYNGAKSVKGCLRSTAQGLWLGVFTMPFILLLAPLGLWIIEGNGFEPEVVPEARAYFLILMLGGLRMPLAGAISGWFTGRQLLKLNTIACLTGTLLNFPLDYLFIFGGEKVGLPWIPAMGIKGAAYTTVFCGFVPFVMLLWWYARSKEFKEHGWRVALMPDFPLMRRIVRFGAPSAFNFLVDVGSFTVFCFLIGKLGGISLFVGNACMNINHLAFAPLMAFGFATSIVAARYQGAHEPGHAARTGWSGLKLGWCYMLPLAVVFAAFPSVFYAPFMAKDCEFTLAQIMEIGRPMLIMVAVWGMADTINIVMMSALRGVGDTRFILLCICVGSWLVWIPAEWVAYKYLDAGILVLWGILTVYIFLLGGVFAHRWWRGRWKNIQVIEPHVIE